MLITLALSTLTTLPSFEDPGTLGQPPLALVAAKALTCARGRAPYRLTARSDGRFDGVAAKYQEGGHRQIGFNTDAIDLNLLPEFMRGIFPQTEELSLQAAMGVRYGMDDDRMEAVRGITIVPAVAAGLAHRVGSLEPGKDADVLVITGDPADQRTSVERVFLEGERVYDVALDVRRW